jgi:hypothetical protein
MKVLGAAILTISAGLALHAQQQTGGKEGGPAAGFKGLRQVSRYTQTINASPERIFPLICPIREAEWSDGWIGKVVYAASGYAEQDGVYATEHGEKDDTIWVVTRRDASKHEIEFVYFVPGARVARLTFAIKSIGNGKSNVFIRYTNTGLTETGNRQIAERFDGTNFKERMVEWQEAMNYFLETGKVLKERR